MDISVSESAYLAGKSRFETWKSQYLAKYYQPVTDQMMLVVVQKIMAMPPQVKEEMKKRQPQAFARLEKLARDKKLEVK